MGPKVIADALPDVLFAAHASHFRGVLGGDQNRVDRHGLIVLVNDTDLGFAIREQVVEGAVVTDLCQSPRETVGDADRQRHQLRSFITGVAEHDALISRTHLVERVTSMVIGFINALGDVRGLLIEGNQHSTAVGIKPTGPGAAVANVADHIAHKMDEIHLGL